MIGLMYGDQRADLGRTAGELLRTLEYRGYDSTGAAVQGEGTDVTLRKGVGAPSQLVTSLGIDQLSGQILCGQVRWATFGAVDEKNAQPHVVRCHTFIYGAHNGNVTNCDELKTWLVSEGHTVASDNDGEMVVHTVEHFFAQRLTADADSAGRRQAMRLAIGDAGQKLRGSFAAVIADPVSRTLWAIKNGSSLYFGVGGNADRGPSASFGIASSDLSAVLKMTRKLVGLSAGEVVELDGTGFSVFSLSDPSHPLSRPVRRSRLQAKDTALKPPYRTFMEQEIAAQESTCREVLKIFAGGTDDAQALGAKVTDLSLADCEAIDAHTYELIDQVTEAGLRRTFDEILTIPAFRGLVDAAKESEWLSRRLARGPDGLHSSEAGLFADLYPLASKDDEKRAVAVLDAYYEFVESSEYRAAVDSFCSLCQNTTKQGGRIYVVCCGTSFHAAKAASLFFAALAGVEILPLLPGEFRGQYAETLRDGDLMVAVSQSGETKDLIDVVNQVIESGLRIQRVALVNNINSTLAQEKAHLLLPLHCGPEIAVPATKSFINQLTVFYGLAHRLGELAGRNLGPVPDLPTLIRQTLDETEEPIEEAAKLLYLAPSMHLLATRLLAVAKEGALKIREVVLNHAEGFEGSEFKHGPNTILGVNTVYGLDQVESLLDRLAEQLAVVVRRGAADGLDPNRLGTLVGTAARVFDDRASLSEAEAGLVDSLDLPTVAQDALYRDYPLIYITGPDARDVALTVSQINTHKIRGATTIIIAEDHPELRLAAEKPPADNPNYRSVFIPLPPAGDALQTAFSATVALQRLALRMSELKYAHLDRLGIADHGVHPDVPKNVSKSITVD
ncbi:MAG: SIS domain-containing protein [Myxococcota bacterium]